MTANSWESRDHPHQHTLQSPLCPQGGGTRLRQSRYSEAPSRQDPPIACALCTFPPTGTQKPIPRCWRPVLSITGGWSKPHQHPSAFHQVCEQFCETESTFPSSKQHGELKAARLKFLQSPLAGSPGTWFLLKLRSLLAPRGLGETALRTSRAQPPGACVRGCGDATGAKPCLHPDLNAPKTRGQGKT